LANGRIIDERDEIASKEIVHHLAMIEGGPWAEWGKDRKPITQNALARLLKPHKIYPVDVGPERSRRKGYKRSQLERLFEAYLRPSSPSPTDNRAAAQDAMESVQADDSRPRSPNACADGKCEKHHKGQPLRGCADAEGGCRQDDDGNARPTPMTP
jgi:hypothetical protein